MFVGRSLELQGLAALLDQAAAGQARFGLISGEAGIGKTRLAQELTRSAEAAGWRSAWGRSWEGSGTPAYWPWTQVLRRLRAFPECEPSLAAPELAALLDPVAAQRAAPDAEQARFVLFERVARVLEAGAQAHPLLVVLDDLHAADAATLSLLQFVARSVGACRLLIVGSARDATGVASAGPSELARVAREAQHFPLSRLGAQDVGAWVAQDGTSLEPGRVFRASEGNPLFVEELLATARKYPAAALSGGQLPVGIREAIRARLALLSGPARELLGAAAVLGRDLSLEALRRLAPRLEGLDAAFASGVVHDLGDGKLSFAHVLLRDELYEELGGEQRGELHRAVARTEPEPRVAAHHALEGARPEDGSWAAALALAGVRDASRRLAHEDAGRLGQRALDRLGAQLPPSIQLELLVEVAEARVLAGDLPAAQAGALRAAELAAELGEPLLLGRAALTLAAELRFGGDSAVAAWLRRALAALPEGHATLRVELMARLAVSINNQPDHQGEQMRLLDEAVVIARRSGHQSALVAALYNAAGTYPERLSPRERFALYAEAVDLAEATGTIGKIAPLLAWHVVSFLEVFEPERAWQALARVERLLQPYARPHYRWRAPLIRALLESLAGRFAEADRLSQESLTISKEGGVEEGLTMYAIFCSSIAYLRDDDHGLSRALPEVESRMRGLPMFEIFRCIWDAPLGRLDAVRASFEIVKGLPNKRLPGVAALGWPCARAGLKEYAELFYELFNEQRPEGPLAFAPGGFGCFGPHALMLGQLAALTGRVQLALELLDQAAREARELHSPPLIAQAEIRWAEVLQASSPLAAAEHARLGLELARPLGLEALCRRAEALLGAPPGAAPAAETRPSPGLELRLRREGDVWLLQSGSVQLRLAHSKGLAYLQALLATPHRPVHSLELSGIEERTASDPVLDPRALREYRARAAELQQELGDATASNDLGRMQRLQSELDAIGDELGRALGLGGRVREQGSPAERARINVQRRLRDLIRRVAEQDSALGRHLELSIRTGNFCMYSPTWPTG